MHAKSVSVLLPGREYEVYVGSDELSKVGERAANLLKPGKCGVLADSNTGPLYAARLMQTLTDAGFSPTLVEVPAGETSKALSEVESVCEELIRAGLDRHACLFALGGGVVGDLGGFVASIFFRGIPYFQIPTTIVSQVDSSVGGKTGVNSRLGKNLIGSFHQPAAVFVDPLTLQTLPDREFYEGFGEVVKHAIIRDAGMLEQISSNRSTDLSGLIASNIAIKAAIVTADEKETLGLRALLNFGHTVGHAIENAAGYGQYLHGEAISLGTVAALFLSVKLAGLPQSEMDRVIVKLDELHLPTRLTLDLTNTQILTAMGTDKKFERGKIRFVLTQKLGSAFLASEVTQEHIQDALSFLRR